MSEVANLLFGSDQGCQMIEDPFAEWSMDVDGRYSTLSWAALRQDWEGSDGFGNM